MSKKLSPLEELKLYLRPPGQGIHLVSTGKKESDAFVKEYMGDGFDTWDKHLDKLKEQKVAILGVPSDNGAGIVRGCAWGPHGIRKALKKPPAFDMGDVFCVPHFLTDDMISDSQIDKTQKAIYGSDNKLPVSPLSICKRVYELCQQINPDLKILLLGGDHSVTWPALETLMDHQNQDEFAIVHFDAHTDLSVSRLGVDICFGTWAHHINQRLSPGGRLVQLGIRASAKTKEFWETEHQVKQYWGHEVQNITPENLTSSVVEHLDKLNVKNVYITNDIDGTDSKWATACGSPEPGGLTPDQVKAVILAMKKYNVIGADLVEVAPALSLSQELSDITLKTAVSYLHSSLEVL